MLLSDVATCELLRTLQEFVNHNEYSQVSGVNFARIFMVQKMADKYGNPLLALPNPQDTIGKDNVDVDLLFYKLPLKYQMPKQECIPLVCQSGYERLYSMVDPTAALLATYPACHPRA